MRLESEKHYNSALEELKEKEKEYYSIDEEWDDDDEDDNWDDEDECDGDCEDCPYFNDCPESDFF